MDVQLDYSAHYGDIWLDLDLIGVNPVLKNIGPCAKVALIKLGSYRQFPKILELLDIIVQCLAIMGTIIEIPFIAAPNR